MATNDAKRGRQKNRMRERKIKQLIKRFTK